MAIDERRSLSDEEIVTASVRTAARPSSTRVSAGMQDSDSTDKGDTDGTDKGDADGTDKGDGSDRADRGDADGTDKGDRTDRTDRA